MLEEKGVEHQKTMPDTPQQNGRAEQFNHTIMDKAMAILHQAGLTNGFWQYAVDTVVHTYNCIPTRLLEWHTPHER